MSSISSLAGKKVLVMGLGRFGGGVGVSRWLAEQGALVTVNDAATAAELADSINALDGLPITFKLGGHDPADFLAAELIVINPAVDRAKSDVVQAALKKSISTTTELNLFLERCPAITVGITGSVGKSTTTALIFEALKAALHDDAETRGRGDTATVDSASPRPPVPASPRRVYLGGNIGRSLLADLPNITDRDVVVLELSSFMLDETPAIQWSPHIAVVTNVFPNHLDRHGTMAAYSASKQNILRFQKPTDIAILNADHDLVSRWVHLAKGRVVKYTARGPSARQELAMPGEHNQSNAAAARATVACLAAEQLPIDMRAALRAISAYAGLPHRLQCVHTLDLPGVDGTPRRVRFYNDSKATSPDASITAINAFDPQTAIFIMGGYDKHIDMNEFQSLLAERAAGVLGIGQTGETLLAGVAESAKELGGAAPAMHYAGTLADAIAKAREWAHTDSRVRAVVLSPASASWGQFTNYEQRGDEFARLAALA